MNLFYARDLDEISTKYFFDRDESRHIIKVLRKKLGEHLLLTNGKGICFTAEIIDTNPKKTGVKIIHIKQKSFKKPLIHIALAPTKSNDRTEWFLEKATEIGISQITPIITEHSERRKVNLARYEKVIISAMKQSLKVYKPSLKELIKFSNFIKQDFGKAKKFIAYCQSDLHLKNALGGLEEVVLLIGPEGGFSIAELELAKSNGFIPIGLSEYRLRTETAALMAVATVHLCASNI